MEAPKKGIEMEEGERIQLRVSPHFKLRHHWEQTEHRGRCLSCKWLTWVRIPSTYMVPGLFEK